MVPGFEVVRSKFLFSALLLRGSTKIDELSFSLLPVELLRASFNMLAVPVLPGK